MTQSTQNSNLPLEMIDLHKAKQRLELVLEGTRLGMWDWNPQTNDVHFDQRWAEMLGYDIFEVEQHLKSWEEKVHPDDLSQCYADIQAHMEGKRDFYENVHRMKHKNGHWVYILDRGKIVERDKEGKPVRFTGTHTDITKEKLAELNALEAAKAKSYFLANMSHEIRTPLHGILGLARVLSDEDLNPDNHKLVNTILEAGNSLLTILNDILDLTKLEESNLRIQASNFEFRSFINECVNIFYERLITKNLHIKLEIQNLAAGSDKMSQDQEIYLNTDKDRLRQVLTNIIGNAVKFTDEGEISIIIKISRLNETKLKLDFSISDTGIGIEASELGKVFERFYQANQEISNRHGGTGLGLPISKLIIEKMGGEIHVESELGEGTTFSFFIESEVGEKVTLSQEKIPKIQSSKKILVVDDNKINRLVMEKILAKMGLQIDLAEDGKDALDKIKTREYDIVFMDLKMPDMSGFVVFDRIQEMNLKSKPKIIALTADAFEETRTYCLEYGFNDYLSKPFTPNDLVAILVR